MFIICGLFLLSLDNINGYALVIGGLIGFVVLCCFDDNLQFKFTSQKNQEVKE
jgi:hypothetical protein